MKPTLTETLSFIRAECHKAIELGNAATPGPWVTGECEFQNQEIVFRKPNKANANGFEVKTRRLTEQDVQDATFIAHSRTFSPKAARATLVMMDAMEAALNVPGFKNVAGSKYISDAIQTLADQWNETK